MKLTIYCYLVNLFPPCVHTTNALSCPNSFIQRTPYSSDFGRIT